MEEESEESEGQEQNDSGTSESIEINTDNLDPETGTENSGESEFEGEEAESADFVPTARISTANPFLEQSSGLEQELENVPSQAAATPDKPGVFNAPQYASSAQGYSEKGYYEIEPDNTYPQPVRSTITTSSDNPAVSIRQQPFSEDLDFGRLPNPRETTAWRSEERLQSWDMEDEKKYDTHIKTKKREVW